MAAPGSYAGAYQNGRQVQREDTTLNDQDANDGYSDDSNGDAEGDGYRKRKRPMSVSCELCKNRKVKSRVWYEDFETSLILGWCLRNKVPCEYRERKKPGLRAGYGRELETRLDKLESVLAAQGQSIAHLYNHTGLSGTQQTIQEAPMSTKPTDETNMFSSPSMSQARGSATPAQNNFTPQSGISSARLPYSKPYNAYDAETYQKQDPTPPQPPRYYTNSNSQFNTELQIAPDHDLPPYDLLYSLTDLYFKHVNTWCPMLHRKATFDLLFGPSSPEEGDRILQHAIVATTLRYSTDPRLTPEAKAKYYTKSKDKVLLYGLQTSSVVMTLDFVGTSNGAPSWNLIAVIVRAAIQLGLTIEATSWLVTPKVSSIYTLRALVLPESSSFIEDEARRRLLWIIYLLDRFATITTAFDFALDENEVDRLLPCRDDFFLKNQRVGTLWSNPRNPENLGDGNPEHHGPLAYSMQVLAMLTKIHQFLREPVDIHNLEQVERWRSKYRSLDAALDSWKTSLPRDVVKLIESPAAAVNAATAPNIKGGPTFCWLILCVSYFTTIIRLHSSAAYPSRRSRFFEPSHRASQVCLAAADTVAELCACLRTSPGNLLSKVGTPLVFSIWVAARVLLVHSLTVHEKITPQVHTCVATLHELGQYWQIAERYAELLQTVLDELEEAESATKALKPPGERQVPQSVRLMTDMRRCAYDLEFMITRHTRNSQQPPQEQQVPRERSRDQSPQSPQNRQSLGQDHATQEQGLPQSTWPTYNTGTGTPSRTPAPQELNYLALFDWFNFPRPPVDGEGMIVGPSTDGFGGYGTVNGQGQAGLEMLSGDGTGDGIPMYGFDAQSDWLLQPERQT